MDSDQPVGEQSSGGLSAPSSLIRRARENDPAAWQRMFDLLAPLIYTWCRKSGVPPQDIADVMQDVFQSLARGISGFRRERPEDTFLGWLRTVAKHRICDYFRKQARQPDAAGGTAAQQRIQELAAEESTSSVPCGALAGVCRRVLPLIQAEFDPRTWQAFLWIAVDGIAVAEVAERLNSTPGAVRQSKYKVLRRLREELADLLMVPPEPDAPSEAN
jgi:RNA polymerase sigma-70 factor, ECF subfamily